MGINFFFYRSDWKYCFEFIYCVIKSNMVLMGCWISSISKIFFKFMCCQLPYWVLMVWIIIALSHLFLSKLFSNPLCFVSISRHLKETVSLSLFSFAYMINLYLLFLHVIPIRVHFRSSFAYSRISSLFKP